MEQRHNSMWPLNGKLPRVEKPQVADRSMSDWRLIAHEFAAGEGAPSSPFSVCLSEGFLN